MTTTHNELKVLSYNLFLGLQDSEVLIEVFVRWMQEQNPDIVFYQELDQYTKWNLAEMAQRYNHPFAVTIGGGDLRVGLSSKFEIRDIEQVTEGFPLGYIYARILEYHVFAIHLDPFTEENRLRQIQSLLAHAASLPAGADIMIVGDFNSLAATDQATYGTKNFEENYELRYPDGVHYGVTNTLLQAGFHDAHALFHSDFKRSFPTDKRIVPGDAAVRIDYAFLSPTLKKQCLSADFIYDNITSFLSDHYPLAIKLRRFPAGASLHRKVIKR